jgi:CBS domain-containing protein
MKVNELMEKAAITVKKQATIEEIAKILVTNRVSGVPVVDDAGSLIGIVTEGDLLHKDITPRSPSAVNILGGILFLGGISRYNEEWKKLIAKQASEIMTEQVVTINQDADIEDAVRLMLDRRFKVIPVVEGEKVIGTISRVDILKTLYTD